MNNNSLIIAALLGILAGICYSLADTVIKRMLRKHNRKCLKAFFDEYSSTVSPVIWGKGRKTFRVYFIEYQNWFSTKRVEPETLNMDGKTLEETFSRYVEVQESHYPYFYITPIAVLSITPEREPRQRHESQIKTP